MRDFHGKKLDESICLPSEKKKYLEEDLGYLKQMTKMLKKWHLKSESEGSVTFYNEVFTDPKAPLKVLGVATDCPTFKWLEKPRVVALRKKKKEQELLNQIIQEQRVAHIEKLGREFRRKHPEYKEKCEKEYIDYQYNIQKGTPSIPNFSKSCNRQGLLGKFHNYRQAQLKHSNIPVLLDVSPAGTIYKFGDKKIAFTKKEHTCVLERFQSNFIFHPTNDYGLDLIGYLKSGQGVKEIISTTSICNVGVERLFEIAENIQDIFKYVKKSGGDLRDQDIYSLLFNNPSELYHGFP